MDKMDKLTFVIKACVSQASTNRKFWEEQWDLYQKAKERNFFGSELHDFTLVELSASEVSYAY